MWRYMIVWLIAVIKLYSIIIMYYRGFPNAKFFWSFLKNMCVSSMTDSSSKSRLGCMLSTKSLLGYWLICVHSGAPLVVYVKCYCVHTGQ